MLLHNAVEAARMAEVRGSPDAETLARLARELPDIPRWVETRSLLLVGECELFGLDESDELSFVVRGTGYPLVSVVGRPSKGAIREAVAGRRDCEVLVPPENGAHVAAALPGWERSAATLHLLGDETRLPRVPAGAVRLLDPRELGQMEGLPRALREELVVAARTSPVAASFDGGRPVAFCYADRTEGLWDVSIDTLEGYRRQGHAARCVAFVVEHLRPLRPVWGAENTNRASLGLATRLGFVPVDEVLLFRKR
jgi:GNAT superfamily N-acetyltransferase